MSLTSKGVTHDVLNAEELLARCMGNIDFAMRVLAKFQDRFQEDMRDLDQAISARDAEQAARIAHRIKGASANVAAGQLYELSAEIERCGRSGQLSDASTGLDRLRDEWTRFTDRASSLCAEMSVETRNPYGE